MAPEGDPSYGRYSVTLIKNLDNKIIATRGLNLEEMNVVITCRDKLPNMDQLYIYTAVLI